MVNEPLATDPVSDLQIRHQIDNRLLEHPRANRVFHVVLTAAFEHDRVNPVSREQKRQRQTCRAGSNNPYLRPLFHTEISGRVPAASLAPRIAAERIDRDSGYGRKGGHVDDHLSGRGATTEPDPGQQGSQDGTNAPDADAGA